MNINNLLIGVGLAALSSCSTAYQSAQMPDDLYYSPPTQTEEYISASNGRDKYSPYGSNRNDRYDDMETYRNDRFMRMSIGSPYRMSMFDSYYWNDWGYGGFNRFGYSPFSMSLGFHTGAFGYMNPWNNPWAAPMYWNGYYNPYAFNYNPHYYGGLGNYGGYYGGIIPNAKPPVYRAPAPRATVFNRGAYKTTGAASRSYYNPRTGNYSNYSNSNSINNREPRRVRNASSNTYYDTRQNTGNDNRTYTPPQQQRPQRTYTPAPSSNSGRSSGTPGSSGGGVRRPTRN